PAPAGGGRRGRGAQSEGGAMLPADPAPGGASASLRRFFGGALMAIGILIMVLAGLCTSAIAVMTMIEPGSAGEILSILLEAVLVAAMPAAIGAGLFFLGRAIMRPKTSHPNPPPQGGRG